MVYIIFFIDFFDFFFMGVYLYSPGPVISGAGFVCSEEAADLTGVVPAVPHILSYSTLMGNSAGGLPNSSYLL
ncbi:MAG: hypothetical protein IKR26_07260 [Lachnospiraceae bacterium]|nr:hypothetical protein [Lachnospiraceae bacterium]